MKVWVIGRGYPTLANRMFGSFELEQAKLLARNGYEVVYIALMLSFFDRKEPRGLRTFDDNGVKVYTYSHFYFPGRAGIYWEKFEDKCWGMLFEKVEQEMGLPNIIHVHYPTMISSINVIKMYKERGIKLFVTEHWSRVLLKSLRKYELSRLQYYTKNADCFISVSKALQSSVQSMVAATVPMKVIPNMVSPLFFEERNTSNKNSESFIFIIVGRLISLKQFDIVIKQFLKEFAGNEGVYLRIVGGGSNRRKLERLVGDNPQITFVGKLTSADTAKEIANANVLVSFSKYETFAVPVAEAWACGKPVIVSAESGVAAYVNDEVGVTVQANAPEKLGSALKMVYTEYNKYFSSRISSYAKDNFSDYAIIKMLKKIYDN